MIKIKMKSFFHNPVVADVSPRHLPKFAPTNVGDYEVLKSPLKIMTKTDGVCPPGNHGATYRHLVELRECGSGVFSPRGWLTVQLIFGSCGVRWAVRGRDESGLGEYASSRPAQNQ